MLLLSLLLSGCRPSIIFQATRPADITVSPEITTLALLDRVADVQSAELVGFMEQGLVAGIVDPPRFTLAPRSGSPSALAGLDVTDGGALPKPTVETFCERTQASGVVSLRSLALTEDWDFAVRTEDVTDSVDRVVNGRTVTREVTRQVTIHTATHNVSADILMRLYDCDGSLVDSYTVRVVDFWEGEGEKRGIARTDAGEPEDHISALMDAAAFNYLRHISPYDVAVERSYYRRPDGSREIAAGNLDQAEQMLRAQIKQSDGKKKGRALYDLAIVKEQQGDLDGAVKVAKRADRQLDNDLSAQLLRQLRNRRAQDRAVTEQTAPEEPPEAPESPEILEEAPTEP